MDWLVRRSLNEAAWLQQHGDLPNAIPRCEQALLLAPGHPEVLIRLAANPRSHRSETFCCVASACIGCSTALKDGWIALDMALMHSIEDKHEYSILSSAAFSGPKILKSH